MRVGRKSGSRRTLGELRYGRYLSARAELNGNDARIYTDSSGTLYCGHLRIAPRSHSLAFPLYVCTCRILAGPRLDLFAML